MADQIQIDCPEDNDPVNTTFSVTGTVTSSFAAARAKRAAQPEAATTVYVRCVVWNPANGQTYTNGIQTTTPSWTYNFTTALPTLSLAYLVAQLMDGPTEPAGVLSSDSCRISVVAGGGVNCSSA